MTPTKVVIEVTSSKSTTRVVDCDGQLIGEYVWERIGAGSWQGGKRDWYAILKEADDEWGSLDELAESLEDLSFTSIGYALGKINCEEF